MTYVDGLTSGGCVLMRLNARLYTSAKKNPRKNYSMNGVNLAVSDMERDLGVNMHVSL